MADLTLTLVRPKTEQKAAIFQSIKIADTNSATCALVNDLDDLWGPEHDCAHLDNAQAIDLINR
jgi:hypothetical protein